MRKIIKRATKKMEVAVARFEVYPSICLRELENHDNPQSG
jgi:hypothetical protein